MIGVGALRVLLSSGEASEPVDHTAPAAAVMATVELAAKAPSEALNCRTYAWRAETGRGHGLIGVVEHHRARPAHQWTTRCSAYWLASRHRRRSH
jgi:hypothetical protein